MWMWSKPVDELTEQGGDKSKCGGASFEPGCESISS